ncbi:Heme A synthase, cytochrome oxidase biogenesis protein Cox15-CtaA [hydrothermal vent metagenome]|uniref:Heme A synthase, cytochrome oxidase biogenesis protein Cox15-CtaA n=1 Tax=hydrothermal vent metagenome TaxID=652676 RepID=A0A3B0U402_9ZZZZ
MSIQTAINSLDAPKDDLLGPVRVWLYSLAIAILAMVALGGLTRLTDSGLSITTWKPISGIIPPLSNADWLAEFNAYKLIPEFKLQNSWMDLAAFKSIFWWEWGHRFLGRMIGFLFAVPFIVFLVQKRLSWRLAPSLGLLFVLGGFQGLLGWWMVSSGLSERVDVSQYRLAAHLAAASLLFVSILWVARRLRPSSELAGCSRSWQLAVWALAILVFLQIIMGAFVAGLDAGFGYNTWPLMEGRFIPGGLNEMQPGWRNLFENPLAVQFTHRMIAYTIALYAGLLFWLGARANGLADLDGWLKLIAVLIVAQIGLGITTLLLVVPIPLAVAHQVLAFILFGSIIAYLADMSRRAV